MINQKEFKENYQVFIMEEKDKKLLSFFAGIILAGISLNYYNNNPILGFIGIMIGAYLTLRVLN